MNPKPIMEAHTLNNLACASWYHKVALTKTKTIPEQTKEKENAEKDF